MTFDIPRFELPESIMRLSEFQNSITNSIGSGYLAQIGRVSEIANRTASIVEPILSSIGSMKFDAVIHNSPIFEIAKSIAYSFSPINNALRELQSTLGEFGKTFNVGAQFESASLNMDLFRTEDGTVYYDGECIDDSFISRANTELSEIHKLKTVGTDKEKASFSERLKTWKEKYWILVYVLVTIVNMSIWTANNLFEPEIKSLFTQARAKLGLEERETTAKMAVKAEFAKVYSDCDIKSNVLYRLAYGTEVVIIDIAKYWRKVTYYDSENECFVIGWIAVINLMECEAEVA